MVLCSRNEISKKPIEFKCDLYKQKNSQRKARFHWIMEKSIERMPKSFTASLSPVILQRDLQPLTRDCTQKERKQPDFLGSVGYSLLINADSKRSQEIL